ncbi:MAG: PHB depolymerase family esterase [Chloroflexota bacterium]
MTLLRLIILGFLVTISIGTLAQDNEASLDNRGYGLYVPSSYDEAGEETLPLVIALHGFGDTWENFYPATGFIGLAESENFIVAFPQGYLRQWNDGSVGDHYEDDVQLLRDLVTRVDRDYRVDFDRIYLAGFSNGGTMVYKAACNAPDLFAGIAAVGGTMRTAQTDSCEDAQLPVVIIHGTADTVVSFDGSDSRFSVPRATLFWAEQNDCNLEEAPNVTDSRSSDGYSSFFYEDCPNGDLVLMHSLEDIGHTWAGAEAYVRGLSPQRPYLDTARIIWGFFDLAYQAELEAEQSPEMTPEANEN